MKAKRFLGFLICVALAIVLMPAGTRAAAVYPLAVQNGTASAATAQVSGGVLYVEEGDTVTVTAALPSGPFTGGYDYTNQAFSYWAAEGVALADVGSPSSVFVMPGSAVTLTAHLRTAVPAAPAQPANPFRDLCATMDVFNDRIGVSYTPARDFSVNLMGKHDVSQYQGIGPGDGAAANTLRQAMQEYAGALDAFNDLRYDGGVTYLENAFRSKDQYITMPVSGEQVLICEENWDRIVDEYFAVRSADLDEADLAALKSMRLFKRRSDNDELVVIKWAAARGDPAWAMRDCDEIAADCVTYSRDLHAALQAGLPEDLLRKVKLELGNSFSYEVYYVDGAGNEIVLNTYTHRPVDDTSFKRAFGEIGSAWLNGCQPAFTYRKDAAEQHGYNSSVLLRSVADKVRVRFVTDEALADAAGGPFVANYTDVVVPVPSVLSVSGITPGTAYAGTGTAGFSTRAENLFTGDPGEGELRLLPVSWSLDGAAPGAFTGAFGGTVDMSALSTGGHRLTVNFVYQAYTGGAWVDRPTVVPYGVPFQVSAPAFSTRTLADGATGISVSGNLREDARLTVGDMVLGTDAACEAIRQRMNDGDSVFLLGRDISLSGGFTGTLTICVPVGAQYNGQTVTILHCAGGALETYAAVVADGMAVFSVTGLSPFAVFAQVPAAPPAPPDYAPPAVVTDSAAEVSASGARLSGSVAGGGAAVTERGFVYGALPNPAIGGAGVAKAAAGSGAGRFTAALTGLEPDTVYYARAYAVSSRGVAYGTAVSFRTAFVGELGGVPKTGDGNAPWAGWLLCGAGAAGLAAVMLCKRKRT